MRHPIEGTPYSPPSCPVDRSKDIPDLESVPFWLIMESRHNHPIEIYGTFEVFETNEHGEEGESLLAHVSTGELHVSSEDPLEQAVRRLIGADSGSLKSTEKLAVDLMRLSFCERVADCRGVIDGECWALGAKAVQEVVGEILNVRTDKPPHGEG